MYSFEETKDIKNIKGRISVSQLRRKPNLIRFVNKKASEGFVFVELYDENRLDTERNEVWWLDTRGGKIYAVFKEYDWKEADERVKYYKRNGRYSRLLDDYGKPFIKVELKDMDELIVE